MPRDPAAYLQDILDAAYAIADVMRGVSLEDYRATRSIRSSVEREFIIIGAALRRISALDQELFSSISNSRAIVLDCLASGSGGAPPKADLSKPTQPCT
jgi:uncharacterized protein with HEPN domain